MTIVSRPALVTRLANSVGIPSVSPTEGGLPSSANDITYHLRPSVSSSCQVTQPWFSSTVSWPLSQCRVSIPPLTGLNAHASMTVFQPNDNIMELMNDANLYLAVAGWFSWVEGNSFLMALTCLFLKGAGGRHFKQAFTSLSHCKACRAEQQVRGACGKTLEKL